MRILHTADWHLGRSIEQTSRLGEQAAFLSELQDICDGESVDLLLVCGDVFDTFNPSAASETLFYESLVKLSGQGRRAVIVIAGNHDSPDRLAAAAPLAYRQGIFLIGFPGSDVSGFADGSRQLPDMVEAAGPGYLRLRPPDAGCPAVVLTLPYPSEARLAQMTGTAQDEAENQRNHSQRVGRWLSELSTACFSNETVNLAAAHIYVCGGWPSDSERTLQLGAAVLVEPEDLPAGAHYIALGHLHRPQSVAGSPSPARYAGSPLAYSFSESGYAKSVCLIDAEPGKPAVIRTIPLTSGKPLRRWLARDGLAQALEWCREGRDAGCWIDLEIDVDQILTASDLKTLRDLNPDLVYIRPRLPGDPGAGSSCQDRADRKIDELFADFYRFRYGMPVPDDVLATFLDLVSQAAEEDT
jgi:DNA repair protein SbcD/Mre11